MSLSPLRKRPVRCPTSSDINDLPKEDSSSTSGPLVMAIGSEEGKRDDENFSDDEPRPAPRSLTIDVLSDDTLIYIFNLYRHEQTYRNYGEWSWYRSRWRGLVHVCQRWRHIIFAWPNHLDMQIDCRYAMAIYMALDVWPALPISIRSRLDDDPYADDIIAALEFHERITGIDLSGLSRAQLESCATSMQETFPILRTLSLVCDANTPPVIPDTFLRGRAPRLRNVNLCHVPFPTLPKLLLSANHLVGLHLQEIPETGYISPDAMATCLAMLTRLQSVTISSQFWGSFHKNRESQHPPPMTRAVLPSLTKLTFGGASSKYLDDLMARIHLPLLNHLHLLFFNQPTFGVPELPQIVHHIKTLKPPFAADVDLYEDSTVISLSSPVNNELCLKFQCPESDNQLSWLKGMYPQLLPFLSQIGNLELFNHDSDAPVDQDSTLWLEFLGQFSAVKTMMIYDQNSLSQVARVLGELTDESAAEVLPMLDTIVWFDNNIWDQVESWLFPLVQPFVDARQLLGRPVVVR